MKYLIAAVLMGFALVAAIPVAAAEPSREPLVEQVRKAIEDGKKFLRENQRDKGDWEPDIQYDKIAPSGTTALALLALLVAGEKSDSPAMQRGLTTRNMPCSGSLRANMPARRSSAKSGSRSWRFTRPRKPMTAAGITSSPSMSRR
jgi:hypothetical protein